MLQHFPSRQTDKDAVIISDLSDDIAFCGVSHVSVIMVCDEIRRESSANNPFLPPSGEILAKMKERCISLKTRLENLGKPVAINRPLTEKNTRHVEWADMNYRQAKEAGLIDRIQTHINGLGDRAEDYCKYLTNLCGFSKSRHEW